MSNQDKLVDVVVSYDEWYPVWDFSVKKEDFSIYGRTVSMPKQELKKIENAFAKFWEVQEILKKHYDGGNRDE